LQKTKKNLHFLKLLLTITNLLNAAQSIPKHEQVLSQSRNFLYYMEGSYPHSEASATCPYTSAMTSVPVTTACCLSLQMEEQPPGMYSSYQYIEQHLQTANKGLFSNFRVG
jgi:hypothetical protein